MCLWTLRGFEQATQRAADEAATREAAERAALECGAADEEAATAALAAAEARASAAEEQLRAASRPQPPSAAGSGDSYATVGPPAMAGPGALLIHFPVLDTLPQACERCMCSLRHVKSDFLWPRGYLKVGRSAEVP